MAVDCSYSKSLVFPQLQIEEEEEEDDSLPSSHLSASLGQSIEATPTYCDSTFEPSSFEILNSK